MEPVNLQQKQVDRDEHGQFARGQSGNPAGRPPGARNHATVLAEQLFDGASGALANKALAMALEGDMAAMRLLPGRATAPPPHPPPPLCPPPPTTAPRALPATA